MTKDEAIQHMREGSKVSHRFFTDREYIYLKDGEITTEEGYQIPIDMFFEGRSWLDWQTGWFIYAETTLL